MYKRQDPAYAESWFELKNLQNIFFDPRYTKRAWNAAFEWWCLSEYFHLTQQQREDWLEQWEDSMVHAMYCGLPASLKDAGKALQLPDDKAKMREGKALIRYFCCPCKPAQELRGAVGVAQVGDLLGFLVQLRTVLGTTPKRAAGQLTVGGNPAAVHPHVVPPLPPDEIRHLERLQQVVNVSFSLNVADLSLIHI